MMATPCSRCVTPRPMITDASTITYSNMFMAPNLAARR
jgi:hypothetical protein